MNLPDWLLVVEYFNHGILQEDHKQIDKVRHRQACQKFVKVAVDFALQQDHERHHVAKQSNHTCKKWIEVSI